MKKLTCIFIWILLLNFGIVQSISISSQIVEDFDPLVDVNITVDILSIRALEDIDKPNSEPDFFLKLYINNNEYISDIWNDTSYLYEKPFSLTVDVPDNEEYVTVKIQLWEWNSEENVLCDLGNETSDVTVQYNIKTGHWMGQDELYDVSGYGRLNGCDDGSIYLDELDCEIWFNIYQTDYDSDTLPYWIEVNTYHTDPMISNFNEDVDNDGLPIEYEHKWGFDPITPEDHQNNDYDIDSLNNYEEFLTKEYKTDPFRKDILIEYDSMETGPDGNENTVPLDADDMLKNPFHRRNIVFHIERDDIIPYKENFESEDVYRIYDTNFLDNDSNNWKRSVFHYGLFVNECSPPGYGFSGDVEQNLWYDPGTNSFVISCRQMERSSIRDKNSLAYTHGSAIMHEMGHHFGIRFGNPLGCDNRGCIYPWRLGFWLFWNYKSCMNYRYTYKIFDYSDGSHGVRDFDDWSAIDLSYFEIPE
jgi:hypothetical protein